MMISWKMFCCFSIKNDIDNFRVDFLVGITGRKDQLTILFLSFIPSYGLKNKKKINSNEAGFIHIVVFTELNGIMKLKF